MADGWFRLYSAARNDARLRALSAEVHRVWFNLLCYAAERGKDFTFDYPGDLVMAVEVAGGDVPFLGPTLGRLRELGLLQAPPGQIRLFVPWDAEEDPARDEWLLMRRKVAPQVFAHDGFRCVYCGSGEDLTVDHIMPLSRGGSNELPNLQTACRSCNSSKHDKTPQEWLR